MIEDCLVLNVYIYYINYIALLILRVRKYHNLFKNIRYLCMSDSINICIQNFENS